MFCFKKHCTCWYNMLSWWLTEKNNIFCCCFLALSCLFQIKRLLTWLKRHMHFLGCLLQFSYFQFSWINLIFICLGSIVILFLCLVWMFFKMKMLSKNLWSFLQFKGNYMCYSFFPFSTLIFMLNFLLTGLCKTWKLYTCSVCRYG